MAELKYIPGTKLLLSRVLAKKGELDLLEEEFCTVSEIPAKLAETLPDSPMPSYSLRTVNTILQFEEVDTQGPERSQILPAITLNDYYKDKTVLLAGDPTGSVYFLVDRNLVQELKLDKKALAETKFVECSSGQTGFINTANNISLDLRAEII